MATRHTYASSDDLRDYIAGTTYSSGWTSDATILKRILETASSQIDDYVGMQSFGPRTETHYFDIGSGSLRDTPQVIEPSRNATVLNPSDYYKMAIPFDAWLVSATTVTSYKQTARTESETLTEGYANDYFLEPYNANPKVGLKLNEDTAKSFHGGQQTLAITGTWGFTNDTTPQKTTADAISSTTVTSVSVASAANLSPAQTVLIDSEQLYISSVSGNTLTVERGVNGTTAATHSGGVSVYLYIYPESVSQACLDIGKIFFRDRDQGVTDVLGAGAEGITRSTQSIKSILMTLNHLRSTTPTSMVVF